MSERIANREVRRNMRMESPEALEKKDRKKRKKIAEWIKSLPLDKQKFIAEFTNAESSKACDRYTEQFSEALNRCLTAGLIAYTDYSLDEINKILNKCTDFIQEDTTKVRELKRIAGGDWMKAADKHKEKLIDRSLEMIKEGKKDKAIKDTLAIEFPMLSKAMITNAYKKVKEETKIVVEAAQSLKVAMNAIEDVEVPTPKRVDTDVEKGIEYIFGAEEKESIKNNDEKVEKKMIKKEVKPVVKEEIIDKSLVELAQEGSAIHVVSMKVIKELQANTEFGEVQAKSGEGIKFKTPEAEIFFADSEQLENFYNVGKKIFEMI